MVIVVLGHWAFEPHQPPSPFCFVGFKIKKWPIPNKPDKSHDSTRNFNDQIYTHIKKSKTKKMDNKPNLTVYIYKKKNPKTKKGTITISLNQ